MKWIHTADWLLGIELPNVYAQANRLRQARLETVERILALAEHEGVDGVAVTGNVFADNRIDSRTVLALADRLSRSAVPVYLVAGARDPYTPDSPYRRFRERFGAPVQVVAADHPDLRGLGAAPGTPEPIDFGPPGSVLVVDVEAGTVASHDVAGYRWVELSGDAASLEAATGALERPLQTVLRVVLTGSSPAGELEARLGARFFRVEMRDQTVAVEFPTPLLSGAAERVRASKEDADVVRRALRKLAEMRA